MRLAWAANSVKVRTTRSGAPSTDIDPIEPENIPTSKPRSSAMRAEIASYTEPGCTQRFPEKIARERSRRSVQFIVFPSLDDLAVARRRALLFFRSPWSAYHGAIRVIEGSDHGQANRGDRRRRNRRLYRRPARA